MSEKTLSKYAVVFDDRCFGWTKYKDINFMFVICQQNSCNDRLKARGWLFLRDVYEMLGIQVTKERCLVGWIFEDNNQYGDNSVKFTIIESDGPNITLDFNVDGGIINRL